MLPPGPSDDHLYPKGAKLNLEAGTHVRRCALLVFLGRAMSTIVPGRSSQGQRDHFPGLDLERDLVPCNLDSLWQRVAVEVDLPGR